MLTSTHYYIAVRKTEGKVWFDIQTLNVLGTFETAKLADAIDKKLGICNWAKVNPVVRYARVDMAEKSSLPVLSQKGLANLAKS